MAKQLKKKKSSLTEPQHQCLFSVICLDQGSRSGAVQLEVETGREETHWEGCFSEKVGCPLASGT